MHLNSPFTLDQLAQYLATPDSKRPFAQYRDELLNPEPTFTSNEVSRLTEIVRIDPPQYPKTIISKLLIDLAWASSHLEGNTYTQLETQALLEYGERNADKPADDAVMILNHKSAIEYMLAHLELTEATVLAIHQALANNHLAPGSRHFLDPHKSGKIRSYTEHGLNITGSSYLPPQAEVRPVGFLDLEFTRLIASANALADAINQSFFIMTRIPYLQVFYDVNKRTARICCNIPLVRQGLAPLSFVDFEKQRYLEGMVAFYELGDERLVKSAFLDAYLDSAFRYLPLSEPARLALATDRARHLAAAHRYVVEGVRESDPIWLSGSSWPQPAPHVCKSDFTY